MDYQVTARKWRPQSFKEIIGQDSIVTTVKNALSSGKIPHAFLFSGVRGVGKTTTARVIAKALNCPDLKDFEPCNKCSSCVEITNGYSMDVIEIDGASNRGIDNIRQIKDTVAYMPMSGKYKIYIIDEVHMLTNEASNALLKTLEEPPEHVIFILATTEPHKVLPTIKSRCQHFVFRKIPTKTILEQLQAICKKEKIDFTEEALYLIATAADGSMRDAESVFDQVVLYTDGQVKEEAVERLIGIPDMNYFTKLVESVVANDPVAMLRTVNEYMDAVGDIKVFTKNFIQFVKNGLLVRKLPANDPLIDLTETKYKVIKDLFQTFTEQQIIQIMNLFIGMFRDLKGDANERFLFEITLFKLLDYRNIVPLGELRNEMLELIKKNEGPAPVRTAPSQSANQSVNKTVVVEKPTTTTDRPHNSNPGNDVDIGSVKKALELVMSESLVMKPMIPTIKNIFYVNNALKVEFSNAHNCEFLTNYKGDIQKGVEDHIKRPVHIQFIHDGQDNTPVETPQNMDAPNPLSSAKAESANKGAGLVKNMFDGKEIE